MGPNVTKTVTTDLSTTPQQQSLARRLLVASIPAARKEARSLVEQTMAAKYDGRLVDPLRVVARSWALTHGFKQHWFIERVTHVLIAIRRFAHSAEDPRIFNERWSLTWATYDDCEGEPDDERRGHSLMCGWEQFSTDADEGRLSLDELTAEATRLPIAADPTTTSRGAFLRLAGAHYDARAKALKQQGISLVGRQRPELAKHASWFVRFQIGRESYSAIVPPGQSRQVVQMAVHRFADAVGVELRTVSDQDNI